MRDFIRSSEYEQLPECIKQNYTEEGYGWLPDDMKRTLIQDECDPEVE